MSGYQTLLSITEIPDVSNVDWAGAKNWWFSSILCSLWEEVKLQSNSTDWNDTFWRSALWGVSYILPYVRKPQPGSLKPTAWCSVKKTVYVHTYTEILWPMYFALFRYEMILVVGNCWQLHVVTPFTELWSVVITWQW